MTHNHRICPVIPAQYVEEAIPGGFEHLLLTETGDDWDQALDALERLRRELMAAVEAHDRDSSLGGEKPDDIRLHRPISLPQTDRMTVHDVQQMIASQTDM